MAEDRRWGVGPDWWLNKEYSCKRRHCDDGDDRGENEERELGGLDKGLSGGASGDVGGDSVGEDDLGTKNGGDTYGEEPAGAKDVVGEEIKGSSTEYRREEGNERDGSGGSNDLGDDSGLGVEGEIGRSDLEIGGTDEEFDDIDIMWDDNGGGPGGGGDVTGPSSGLEVKAESGDAPVRVEASGEIDRNGFGDEVGSRNVEGSSHCVDKEMSCSSLGMDTDASGMLMLEARV